MFAQCLDSIAYIFHGLHTLNSVGGGGGGSVFFFFLFEQNAKSIIVLEGDLCAAHPLNSRYTYVCWAVVYGLLVHLCNLIKYTRRSCILCILSIPRNLFTHHRIKYEKLSYFFWNVLACNIQKYFASMDFNLIYL